jgi:hypothetical protein
MCLDGNFGLVRKRSSGRSFEPPKHCSRIFADDDTVRSFVAKHSADGKADDTVCLVQYLIVVAVSNKWLLN